MKNLFYPFALRCILVIFSYIAGHAAIAQPFSEGAIPYGDADGALTESSTDLKWDAISRTFRVGAKNNFLGKDSGNSNAGVGNFFAGETAGFSNLLGNHNIFMGHRSGYFNTNGGNNIFLGAARVLVMMQVSEMYI